MCAWRWALYWECFGSWGLCTILRWHRRLTRLTQYGLRDTWPSVDSSRCTPEGLTARRAGTSKRRTASSGLRPWCTLWTKLTRTSNSYPTLPWALVCWTPARGIPTRWNSLWRSSKPWSRRTPPTWGALTGSHRCLSSLKKWWESSEPRRVLYRSWLPTSYASSKQVSEHVQCFNGNSKNSPKNCHQAVAAACRLQPFCNNQLFFFTEEWNWCSFSLLPTKQTEIKTWYYLMWSISVMTNSHSDYSPS